jgi:DNA modification methylase
MANQILHGDSKTILQTLPSQTFNTCVTSPPYWGLRDYGVDDQLGLEETPEQYVKNMVEVFREVKRVLKDDGTLWLNLGDSYAGSGKGRWEYGKGQKETYVATKDSPQCKIPKVSNGLKPKDLVGIPWMVAFALRTDGWYLRSDIIWSKPNPMPESVKDRPTKSHEYIFLLSKSQNYYYDSEAIKEPIAISSIARLSQDLEGQKGSERANGGG